MSFLIMAAQIQRGLSINEIPKAFHRTSYHHLDLATKIKLRSVPDLKIGRGVLCPGEVHDPL
jgi:hypothetical protein